MVAAHRDHVGSERAQFGHDRVELFDRGDLARAVAVFTSGVGVLVVQEEVVVVVPRLAQDRELLVEIRGAAEHVHAEQARDAAVHRVDRDRSRLQPVARREARELTVGVEPAEEDDVRARLVGERGAHVAVELGDEVGGVLGVAVERLGGERRHAGALRVGVGEAGVEPLAAQHDEQSVFALVPEEHLDPGDAHRRLQVVDDGAGVGVGDAARAPVGDGAVSAEGGDVAAGRDVTGLELEVEPGGGEGAAPELELDGVVAEQAQVAGAGAGGDAGADGLRQPCDALGREAVEVRGDGFFELGAVLGVGVPAEAVHHHEEDGGVGRLDQLGQVHGASVASRVSRLVASDPCRRFPRYRDGREGARTIPQRVERT